MKTYQVMKRKLDLNLLIKIDPKNLMMMSWVQKKKREAEEVEEVIEYIPIESSLVIHICPVLNYYVVIAYLSDDVVDEIRKLPNVISCTKSTTFKNFIKKEKKRNTEGTSTTFYDKEKILEETKWNDLGVQDHDYDFYLRNTHLSLISQGKFSESSDLVYDNNYYYPSSAGKGIDIYVIDNGLDTSFSEEDFDTYAGTPDERIIKCDGIFYEGQYHAATSERNCTTEDEGTINHGTLVSVAAMGKLHGAAKKANLHMLAIDYETYDILTALDYIKENATPHKSVINISSGCDDIEECMDNVIDDKVFELSDAGFIIIVSAGNSAVNSCDLFYSRCKGVIPVGGTNNSFFDDYGNMESMYEVIDFSNYGECVQIFAPAKIRINDPITHEVLYAHEGTSFSSPIVAGVASTIMSENPDTKYNFELMKKALIDLSLKDVLKGMDENTPNRLLNNGKASVYGRKRCYDSSNDYQCGEECCSKYGVCVDPNAEESYNELCLLELGCQSEFGYCTTKKCGESNDRKCLEGECCSESGDCKTILEDRAGFCYVENGCISKYSDKCLSSDVTKINDYDEIYHEQILTYNCEQVLKPINKYCVFTDDLLYEEPYDEDEHKSICDNYEKANCKEFFNGPEKFAPICEKVDGILEDYTNELNLYQQNFFCAKKNPESSNDFCVNTIEDYEDIFYDAYEDTVKDLCPYKECRESLELLLKGKYEKMKRIHEQSGYYTEEKINHFNDLMKYLSTEECINQENTNGNDEPTETPTEIPTEEEKPSEIPNEDKLSENPEKEKPEEDLDNKYNTTMITYVVYSIIGITLIIVGAVIFFKKD